MPPSKNRSVATVGFLPQRQRSLDMVDEGPLDVICRKIKIVSNEELDALKVYGSNFVSSLIEASSLPPTKPSRLCVENPLVYHPRRGAIVAGHSKAFHQCFRISLATRENFSASVITASSVHARAVVAEEAHLRQIYKGCVVELRNSDHLKENWYILCTRLYTDPNMPNLIGEGLWVFNSEDLKKVDPARQLDSDREGVISNYRVQLFSDTVLAVRDIYPSLLDTKVEDNLHFDKYFDVFTLTMHPLRLPAAVYKEQPHREFFMMLRELAETARAQHGPVRCLPYHVR